MVNDGRGGVRLEFAIPTRGLIGLRNAFLTATRGNGVMASRLIGFEPWQGPIASNRTGALVASEAGVALRHGLANAQERGVTFIEPQTEVYEGMIVGQHPRQGDLRGQRLPRQEADQHALHHLGHRGRPDPAGRCSAWSRRSTSWPTTSCWK